MSARAELDRVLEAHAELPLHHQSPTIVAACVIAEAVHHLADALAPAVTDAPFDTIDKWRRRVSAAADAPRESPPG